MARQAGDHGGDQYWSALVTEFDDMIYEAVWSGFAYFQREAGYTRTGSHHARVHGHGHGFEINGISGQLMRVFSSRRESITADLRTLAARFEQRYGRKPSQRELARLAQAANFRTRAAKTSTLDPARLHAGWADKLARALGVPLASVAPSVWHNASGRTDAEPCDPALTELDMARAAQKAVALAQQDKSAWTRADVIKHLGRVLPRTGQAPAAAAALLESLADRALRGEFEPVFCLEAPDPAQPGPAKPAACRPGAASTSGMAACATPPPRSWPWKNACSRKPASPPRRA